MACLQGVHFPRNHACWKKSIPIPPINQPMSTGPTDASPVSINIKENQQPAETDTAWQHCGQLEFSTTGEGGRREGGVFEINPFFGIPFLLLILFEPLGLHHNFSLSLGSCSQTVPVAIGKASNYIPLSGL